MMRRCFLSGVFSLLSSCFTAAPIHAATDAAGVVINEVYYDHPGPDGGHEFVELYNAGSEAVDCGGWVLEGVDGLTWRARTVWVAPQGTVIEAHGFLLVGGYEHVTDPAFRLTGHLENGPDAVRLRRGEDVIDLVGYGPPDADIPCRGRPAPDVAPGLSLARCPDGRDTGDNLADFLPAEPTPGRPNCYRTDLALSLEGPDPLVCAGVPLDLKVRIDNRGLESFSGRVLLRAWCRVAACACTTETALECGALPPGAGLAAAVSLACLHPGGASYMVALHAPEDGNPLNDTLLVTPAVSPAALIVNEIMYRPAPGEGEWIELLNRSSFPIDLSGWSVADLSGATGRVPPGTAPLAPGGFLIVAQDTAGFRRRRPECRAPVVRPQGRWPILNDNERDGVADEITLRDAGGVLVERVAYPALCGSEYGRSIERVSPDVCSALPGGIWQRCSAAGGATAGEINSVASPLPVRAALGAEPNPFGPRRHGQVRITGSIEPHERAYAASIYDLEGVRVRRLAAGVSGARVVSFLWDGRDEGGRPVAAGVYVCLVEFAVRGGGICRREKCVIVVAGGG